MTMILPVKECQEKRHFPQSSNKYPASVVISTFNAPVPLRGPEETAGPRHWSHNPPSQQLVHQCTETNCPTHDRPIQSSWALSYRPQWLPQPRPDRHGLYDGRSTSSCSSHDAREAARGRWLRLSTSGRGLLAILQPSVVQGRTLACY